MIVDQPRGIYGGGDGRFLYYVPDGRNSSVSYAIRGTIFDTEIENGLQTITKTKRRMAAIAEEEVSHGSARQYWIPPGVTPQAKNKHGNEKVRKTV